MSRENKKLDEILNKISECDEAVRYLHHKDLTDAIHAMEDSGQAVPAHVRHLSDEMLNELVEARFDNMPV